MRLITWVLLVGLAVGAVVSGRPAVALTLAGVKAALVGAEFMELRHANRLHAAAFAIAVTAMVLLLIGILARA